MNIIQAEQVEPQTWRNGGGSTRELLAWPNADDWQLRISRADIERDGPFSAFPGVQRWFVVLGGKGVVLYMPTPGGHAREHQLLNGHAPLRFDGELAPGCSLVDGPTQDLNLMVRSGQSSLLAVDADQPWTTPLAMCGIYTAHSGTWHCGAQTQHLNAHTLLWLERTPPIAMQFLPDNNTPLRAWWWGYQAQDSV